MDKILFKETQKFTQWWLWTILIVVLLTPIVGMFYAESKETDLLTKLLLSAIPLAILVLIFVLRLETTITETSIKIQYFPFIKKEWLWSEISKAQVIDYGFVGGWGIRLWTAYGTVYNVKGSNGLHIKTAQKEYVIGTQKEQELKKRIAHLLK